MRRAVFAAAGTCGTASAVTTVHVQESLSVAPANLTHVRSGDRSAHP